MRKISTYTTPYQFVAHFNGLPLDVPSGQTSQESKSSRCNLKLRGGGGVSHGDLPVRSGQEDEAHEKAKEDGNEDDISAEGADQIHQAHETHEQQEEAYAIRPKLVEFLEQPVMDSTNRSLHGILRW